MSQYDSIMVTDEYTVAAEYEPVQRNATACQSEAELEKEFIENLQRQGYEYLGSIDFDGLRLNLRKQIERLNGFIFSDRDWDRFYRTVIANEREGMAEKARRINEAPVVTFTFDNGRFENVKLFDKGRLFNNQLQVVNQYATTAGTTANRYDVTILCNGLPMVHIELKRRGVALREAFNQIERYSRESFWADGGLFDYVQIFVISNGTETKYYSNTTRDAALVERKKGRKKAGGAFEFTSYWSDVSNRVLPDLVDFTRTFFAKHTLLNILANYCVFTSDSKLLVMRPYQIAATERILRKIQIANNNGLWSKPNAGGYVWHTTGSGKTLTSFKTARLASALPFVDKVLFVVDRKDLDYQTIKEYDRFCRGAANGNKNTYVLARQLDDVDENRIPHYYPIIITTIQKLQSFIKKNGDHPIAKKKVVLIFDECHRSQFGDMRRDVERFFKNRLVFGFTGTPIFSQNAPTSSKNGYLTTEAAFGERIHAYNIVDAIVDQNVLPFRIDYLNTIKPKENVSEAPISAIDAPKAIGAPERVSMIVKYILEHFNQKTKRSESYVTSVATNVTELARNPSLPEEKTARRHYGFNSIFAVSRVDDLKLYYAEFKRQLGERFGIDFKVATIFSFAANEEVGDGESTVETSNYEVSPDGILADENSDSTDGLDDSSKQFLDDAIKDYNRTFKTSYDASGEKFGNYYKDVSQRMKNREIDLLLVVNMFLTGFDAPTLNTLWVDKNLKMHGLLQAFSRTNRILNSVKTFGNIVCFLPLEERVNEALALFGNKESGGRVVILNTYEDYYFGYTDEKGREQEGYKDLVLSLLEDFPLTNRLISEKEKRRFVKLFGAILKLRNILSCFDEFAGHEILVERDMQDYQSWYLDIHDEFRTKKEKENINDDLVFEIELVKQVEVNVDYILELVRQFCEKNCEDKEILRKIKTAVESSPALRPKRELVEMFVRSVTSDSDVGAEWSDFIRKERARDLEEIIKSENLQPEATRRYVDAAFYRGEIEAYGPELEPLLPPAPLFPVKGQTTSSRIEKKNSVLQKLRSFFNKFSGLFGD